MSGRCHKAFVIGPHLGKLFNGVGVDGVGVNFLVWVFSFFFILCLFWGGGGRIQCFCAFYDSCC